MVIYAMLSGASIGKLFMGGMVPGVLLAILLMIYVAFISHKRNYPAGVVMSKREFLRATLQALPALFTVVILLGGIYSGICTPTEAGAVASAYALIISALIYKTLGWKKLWGIIKKSAANTATLALLCGTSMLFSYIISLEQVPRVVASLVMGITDNKYIFLFIVNIVFLLLGCVLDVSTIQLVFVPMVLPLVQAMGIDLVHLPEHDDRSFHTAIWYAVVYCFGTWKNEDQGCHTGDFADGAYYDRAVVPGYLCTGYYYVYT